MSLKLSCVVLAAVVATAALVSAQQAVSSVNQARLFTEPVSPQAIPVDGNGNALPLAEQESSGDGSFGAQVILKNQQRARSFHVWGDVSTFYTTNAELLPRNRRSDLFLAANFGTAWRPMLGRGLFGDLSAGGSIFRYQRATDLNFERIALGAGLNWVLPRAGGVIAFARYDFTELFGSGSAELLQDHQLAFGLHKNFAFGRSHFLTTGISGVLGESRPESEERDQIAIHAAYHLQLTRSLDVELLYRYAAQFYETRGRIDHNQALSLAVGWFPASWLRVDLALSAARNDSIRPSFEYEVFNVGSGLKFDLRF